MRKKQYVRRRITIEVIKSDVLAIIGYLITILIAWNMDCIDWILINDISPLLYVLIILLVCIIVIVSIITALIYYFSREKYEEEFDKEKSKEYVERRFCQSIFDSFEVSLVNPKEYSEFFYDAERKELLYFYANLDSDDPENVIITSKLIDGEEKEFETIRKEDFLYHYRAVH